MAEGEGKSKTASGESGASKEDARKRRYSREEVLAEPRGLAGAPRHVASGALAASGKKSWTREEAHSAVERFLKRPVEA